MSTEIASLYAKIGADSDAFSRGMNGVDDRLHATGRGFNALGALGGVAMAGLTMAAVGSAAALGALTVGIGSATKSAANMEQQVADIGSVMALTGAEMEQVGTLIADLGLDPKLKVSATEAGQAIEALGKNGLTLTQIMDGAAKSTVLLANSTGGTFGQAADIATSAMAQFGIAAKDMDGAINQIVGVTVKSKFTIDDYALAIAQAGGVASSVGVSFADFNTTIAAISPLFASGSDAGTSFKTFLQTLIPKSGDAMEAMKQLGIVTADGQNQFFTATGQMKSMGEVAGVLQKAFAGLSDEQKNEAASTIFGTDAMRAAFALAGMTEEQFRALGDEIGKTDAAAAAARRMDTLSGAMEIFQGVLETVGIAIGQKFLPGANKVTKWATTTLTKYAKPLTEWFGRLATIISGVADRLTGAFDTGGLKGVGKELAAMGKEWASALGSWTVDLWRKQVQPGLLAMWKNLTAWVTDPGKRTELFAALTATWTGFTRWAAAIYPSIVGAMAGLWQNLVSWVTDPGKRAALSAALVKSWGMFGQWAGALWATMLPSLSALAGEFVTWVTAPNTWQQISTAIGDTWTFLADWAGELWGNVATHLTDYIGKLAAWATSSTTWAYADAYATYARNVFTQWAGDLWGKVQPKLLEFWTNAVAWIQKTDWRKVITEKWTGFTEWAGGVWGFVAPKLIEFWANSVAWIQKTDWKKAIADKWTGFTDWAAGIWTQVQPELTQFGADLKAWIDTNVPELGTWIDSFLAVTGEIGEGWGLAWPDIQKTMTTAADSITADIDRIQTSLSEIGSWFTGGEGEGFASSWATVFNFVADVIADAVTSSVTKLANLLETIALVGEALQTMAAGDWGKINDVLARMSILSTKVAQDIFVPRGLPEFPKQRAMGGYSSGRTLVGERGPEVVDLPNGSYVHDAEETAAMFGAGTGRLDIYVHGESALPLDRQKLRELAVELRREFNRGGVAVFA